MFRPTLALVTLSFAAPALADAGGQLLGASLEVSCRITGPALAASSAASSEASTEASSRRGEAHQAPAACHTDQDCDPEFLCQADAAGAPHCFPRPPEASSEVSRNASEIYLRERPVQLREELALGRGPVVTGLAAARGLDPLRLGRALRTHRAELAKLIAGEGWAPVFLRRVEQLVGNTAA